MILDGEKITSSAMLELKIAALPEEAKANLRSIYAKAHPTEKDALLMQTRAKVRDSIIAEIGTENKTRIKNGVWTTAQLVSLMQEEQFKAVMNDIMGLSFELAVGKIMAMTNPIVTTDIKKQIVAKLMPYV